MSEPNVDVFTDPDGHGWECYDCGATGVQFEETWERDCSMDKHTAPECQRVQGQDAR